MKDLEPSVAVQWLLKRWDEETRLLSNIEEMMKHPANEIIYNIMCPWKASELVLDCLPDYIRVLKWALENNICVLQSMNLLSKILPKVELKYEPGDVEGTQKAWLEYLANRPMPRGD